MQGCALAGVCRERLRESMIVDDEEKDKVERANMRLERGLEVPAPLTKTDEDPDMDENMTIEIPQLDAEDEEMPDAETEGGDRPVEPDRDGELPSPRSSEGYPSSRRPLRGRLPVQP